MGVGCREWELRASVPAELAWTQRMGAGRHPTALETEGCMSSSAWEEHRPELRPSSSSTSSSACLPQGLHTHSLQVSGWWCLPSQPLLSPHLLPPALTRQWTLTALPMPSRAWCLLQPLRPGRGLLFLLTRVQAASSERFSNHPEAAHPQSQALERARAGDGAPGLGRTHGILPEAGPGKRDGQSGP